jgi:hypothetical protein
MTKTECHVMLDLETLGLAKNAVITRVAAVAFNILDGKALANDFDELVNAKSCTDVGLKIDGDTVSYSNRLIHKHLILGRLHGG